MDWMNVLAPLTVPLVGYCTVLLRTWVKTHTAPHTFAALSGLANTAVDAVEQLDRVSKMSAEQKFDLASDTLVDTAKRLGVKLSPVEVNAFIHSAVKALKDSQAFSA